MILALAVCACGGPTGFGQNDAGADAPDSVDGNLSFPETSTGDGGPCTNLQCDIPSCPTTVSGTVFDPAGKVPLYDVAVYIPNAPIDPISTGIDVTKCDACSAPLSGSPLSVALTDSHGHFSLGSIPVTKSPVQLVIQAGKFRRENYVLPPVTACQDNPIVDPTHNLRLPKNQSEGHLPLIAVATGGCDTLENLIGQGTTSNGGFGIDSTEFQPGPPTGPGRVHVYSSSAGMTSPAYVMWNSKALFNYDIFVSDCECGPQNRGPNAYTNMQTYLEHGGRFFGSHWERDFLGSTYAPAAWQSAVHWYPDWTAESNGYWAPTNSCLIDTTFPKGKALDEWTQFVYGNGYITGTPTPPPGTDPVFGNTAALISGETHAGVTRWIYADSTNSVEPYTATGYDAHYLSINMPYAANPTSVTQCGRAFFGDTHIVGEPTQQSALEFVFFDLSSCVQDESQPPVVPPH